ncbi:MAG TPA: amidohydrolase family protein [Actinomycetota bacterium]|nr:amidohydrolase family protein [Actinomycetota bacterium]
MGRILFRDAALATADSADLTVGISVLVEDGTIAWIRPSDDEPGIDLADVEIVDAGGSTMVPGMVDAHSHITMPGGSHWIERALDPPDRLLRYAEHNAELLHRSGVRWCRDVGAPVRRDPIDGRERGLNLGIRERWRGLPHKPYIHAAGGLIARRGYVPGLTIDVDDADQLLAAARRQLNDGADLIKLFLDAQRPGTSRAPGEEAPARWTADDIRPVVDEAHARGAKVTAHSTDLVGARAGVDAGIDCIEHGFRLDADIARVMAEQGTFLVSTLVVLKSWTTFGSTTRTDRFVGTEGRRWLEETRETAAESVRMAHAAGVRIAAGTDFGGGSTRANHLAWEVESLVEAGLEPYEALAAATRRGGELLDEADAGVIREGGPADFFLVHGDPLSDPSALWRVWHTAW